MARDDAERRTLHAALLRLRDDLVRPADEVTERRHLVAMRTAAADETGDTPPRRSRRRRTPVQPDHPSLTLARLTGRIGFTPTDEELPERLLQAIARLSQASRETGDAARSRPDGGSHAAHPSSGGTGDSRRDACPPGQGGPPPVRTGGGPGGPGVRWSRRYPAG